MISLSGPESHRIMSTRRDRCENGDGRQREHGPIHRYQVRHLRTKFQLFSAGGKRIQPTHKESQRWGRTRYEKCSFFLCDFGVRHLILDFLCSLSEKKTDHGMTAERPQNDERCDWSIDFIHYFLPYCFTAKLDEIWPRLRVLARSSPQDKYTLVKGTVYSSLYLKVKFDVLCGK